MTERFDLVHVAVKILTIYLIRKPSLNREAVNFQPEKGDFLLNTRTDQTVIVMKPAIRVAVEHSNWPRKNGNVNTLFDTEKYISATEKLKASRAFLCQKAKLLEKPKNFNLNNCKMKIFFGHQ